MQEQSYQPAMVIRISSLLPTMTKAERAVSEYIIEHPRDVIHLSVSELATVSGVSDATVIRACQKIGVSSYQNLKISLAQDIVTPLQAVNEAITDSDSPETILEKIFQSTMSTIQLTFSSLRAEDIDLAADKIFAARHIAICGLGNSHTTAMDMQHKFMRLGLNATAYEDSHLQFIGVSFLTPQDVCCCISHSGSSKDIVRSAKIAKENGAFVISLTSVGRSPLSEIADLPLFTISRETQYKTAALSSRIAQLSIVDAIYTFIALKNPNTIEGFFKVEKNLSDTKY